MANKANPQYKSTLFSTIFSEKENALEMYNALNGTDYDDPDEITITTLKNVVFLNRYNDVSYVIGGVFNLYEHQSTYNPNMPLRSFFYIAQTFEKMVDQKNLYSPIRVPIPTPKFVVFYNGTKDQPDRQYMNLSDSYTNKKISGDMELTVTMLNVNYGHNAELMKKCEALNGYSLYISKFREYNESGKFTHSESAERALDYCIKNNVMTEFFRERRKEVVGVILEVTEEVIREWIQELEFVNREQTEIIEAKLKEIDEQAEIITAKEKEIDEQAEIITAKEKEIDEQAEIIKEQTKEKEKQLKENQEQREQIEFQKKELERYKKLLKDNGISE